MDVALAGLKTLAAATTGAKVSGGAFKKPITNFYQTDPISRACVLGLDSIVTGGMTYDSRDVSDLLRWHNVRARSSRVKRKDLVRGTRQRRRRTHDQSDVFIHTTILLQRQKYIIRSLCSFFFFPMMLAEFFYLIRRTACVRARLGLMLHAVSSDGN